MVKKGKRPGSKEGFIKKKGEAVDCYIRLKGRSLNPVGPCRMGWGEKRVQARKEQSFDPTVLRNFVALRLIGFGWLSNPFWIHRFLRPFDTWGVTQALKEG